ncbi:MAG: PAS domain S-box protein [Deltaproteobacteria bacterium]|nr:PAS domain S-box protein [Deltaproteobacteria bacterium]
MSSPKLWNRNTASRLGRALAALPVPALIVLLALFTATDYAEVVFESPWLLTLLNGVFLSLIPAIIVYFTIKAYLGSGSMGLLGLSCGAFLMGLSASVTGLLIGDADGPNKAVTFYNMGFFLAGAFHCAGAAIVLAGIEPESSPRRRRITVAGLYLGMVLVMGLWLMAALNGFTPVFFIQGVGPTLIRQVVLGSAVGLFALSAGLVGLLFLRSRAPFQYWYGLGLFLIAIGLFCVLVPKTVGCPIGWLGRSAQYLGAVYFLVAVAGVVRGIRTGGVVPGEGISSLFQHRLEKLVAERTRELTIINERLKHEISERKQAEEALQKAHNELEQRVGERTADLVREIREREKAERGLRDSHARYKGIFENTRNGIAVYEAVDNGEDFVFIEFNSAGERIDHVDRKDLIGRRVTEVFPGVKEFGLFEVLQRVWRTGTAERHPISTYKDGRIAGWRENFVYKLPSGDVVSVYSDETQRRRAEEALQENEKKYRVLVENAGEVILVAQDGQIMFVNRRISDVTGYLPEELIGKPFSDYIHPDDRETVAERHINQLKGAAGPGVNPFRVITREGAVRWAESNIVLIEWEGKPATLNFITDITDRKRAEEAHDKLQSQLHQAHRMESIGILAGGVAHDFNNLLTTIIGNAQLAQADLPKDDPLREDMEEIRKAGERGAMLTRQLMTFSRREPRQMEILDLNDVVEDMDKLLRRLVRESIELRMIPAPGLWKIRGDVGQMEQVIMNLAVNARDVMPEGGTLTVETANVELDTAFFHAHDVAGEPGSFVMLAVTDTGPGMDKTLQERIFEPFFTTKERGAGTGLGLSTVYGIVKQSEGFIWPYSQPGMGTIMKIYLPRAEDVPRRVLKEETAETEAGGEVVLVAEDNAPLRELAVKALEKAGYRVLTAGDGEEALRVSEAFKGEIHLLITDVVMPRMGGQELAGSIRTQRPGIKVLYMSGFPDRDLSHAGALDSDATFLQKPFTPESLCLKVRETLGT